MKLFFITTMLFSFNALASLDCLSTDKDKLGYRLVIIEKIGSPSTLTIQYKGRNIYKKTVTSTLESNNSRSYSSSPFTNKNNAPAGLYVNVFRAYTQIAGSFNEGSYLPVVPYLQLVCQKF